MEEVKITRQDRIVFLKDEIDKRKKACNRKWAGDSASLYCCIDYEAGHLIRELRGLRTEKESE